MINYMNLSTYSLSVSNLSFVFVSGTTVTEIEPWEAQKVVPYVGHMQGLSQSLHTKQLYYMVLL